MIEKSRAELEHYRLNPNPHTIYNLFVTIYHIEDYLLQGPRSNKKRTHNKLTRKMIKEHFGDLYQWMKFICDKHKHCHLNNPNHQLMQNEAAQLHYTSAINGAPLNTMPLCGVDQYLLTYKDSTYELGGLAEILIRKWEELVP